MKLCCISDTHGRHEDLNLSEFPADVLVYAGDWTKGRDLGLSETTNFLDWLSEQPFKRKVFIAGNHERQVEANEEYFLKMLEAYPTIDYIHHKSLVIDGIKFYGSNYSNEFYDWAFMGNEVELTKIWAKIPKDTNVLITHGPAYGTNDKVVNTYGRDPHVGSKSLHHRKLAIQDSLKVHVSGHIHEAYNILDKGVCVNVCASVLDEKYRLVNKPIITEII